MSGLRYRLVIEGLFTWREEDPSIGKILGQCYKAEQLFFGFAYRNFGMAGTKRKMQFVHFVLSLLTLITTFQQNYHNTLISSR